MWRFCCGNLYCKHILFSTWLYCFHAINCYSSVSHPLCVCLLCPPYSLHYTRLLFFLSFFWCFDIPSTIRILSSLMYSCNYICLSKVNVTVITIILLFLFVSCSSSLLLGKRLSIFITKPHFSFYYPRLFAQSFSYQSKSRISFMIHHFYAFLINHVVILFLVLTLYVIIKVHV